MGVFGDPASGQRQRGEEQDSGHQAPLGQGPAQPGAERAAEPRQDGPVRAHFSAVGGIDDLLGLDGDLQFLVGGNHEDLQRGVRTLQFDGVVGTDAVLFGVEADAEVLEAGADAFAHGLGVLADAGGEDDGVEVGHDRHVRTDVLLHAVAEHLEGGLGEFVALAGGFDDFAHVVDAADALEAGLLVEGGEHLVDVHAGLVHDVFEGRGVDVAGTRAHHEAFERGDAHGGVNALAAADGRDGAPVAEVQADEVGLFGRLAEVAGGGGGDEFVAGAVEAVLAEAVLGVPLVGDGVEEGLGRHRLVEGRVEDGHLHRVREEFLGDLDAHQVRGVVQRAEREEVADGGLDLFVDADGVAVDFAAVQDAVAHAGDFGGVLDDALGRVGQQLDDARHAFVVGREGALLDVLLLGAAGVGLVDDAADRLADLLDQPRRQDDVAVHALQIDQLVLDRRTARIDDQNLHELRLPAEKGCGKEKDKTKGAGRIRLLAAGAPRMAQSEAAYVARRALMRARAALRRRFSHGFSKCRFARMSRMMPSRSSFFFRRRSAFSTDSPFLILTSVVTKTNHLLSRVFPAYTGLRSRPAPHKIGAHHTPSPPVLSTAFPAFGGTEVQSAPRIFSASAAASAMSA